MMYQYHNLYQHTSGSELSLQHIRGQGQGQWDLHLHSQLTEEAQEEKEKLMQELQQVTLEGHIQDSVIWNWTLHKTFSVASFYKAMTHHPIIEDARSTIWNLKAPLRVTIFTWLMLRRKILTVDNLIRKGWQMPNRCIMCKSAQETVQHLFGTCTYITQLVQVISNTMQGMPHCQYFTDTRYEEAIVISRYKFIRKLQLTVCFVLWRERCRRIFMEENKNLSILAMEIRAEFQSWFTHTE